MVMLLTLTTMTERDYQIADYLEGVTTECDCGRTFPVSDNPANMHKDRETWCCEYCQEHIDRQALKIELAAKGLFLGVSKTKGGYIATFVADCGRTLISEEFKHAAQAAVWYDETSRQIDGEYAVLNFPKAEEE